MATHFSIYSAADKAFQQTKGPFMQDILRREEAAKGKEARQHLQFMLATTDHLDDVMAALSFLKTAPGNRRQTHCDCRPLIWRSTNIARRRARQHRSCCGDVRGGSRFMGTFARIARAAPSCGGKDNGSDHADSGGKRLQHGAKLSSWPTNCAVCTNRYVLKIYPPVGRTADDGHNLLYLAIPQWEHDVFGFLDEHVKH